MTIDQILTLLVLAAVVAMLIWDRLRADVVALAGAAILLMAGVVHPSEVQSAFASPAPLLSRLNRRENPWATPGAGWSSASSTASIT